MVYNVEGGPEHADQPAPRLGRGRNRNECFRSHVTFVSAVKASVRPVVINSRNRPVESMVGCGESRNTRCEKRVKRPF